MATPSWRDRYLRWLESFRAARRARKADQGKLPPRGVPRHAFAPPNIDYSQLVLVEDSKWGDVGGSLDPNLRLAVSLIEARDRIQLFERTGVDTVPKPPNQSKVQYLPLHIEFNANPPADTQDYLQSQGVFVPSAYFDEAAKTGQLRCVTARLILKPEIFDGKADAIRSQLFKLGSNTDKPGLIKRISLAGMIQPFFRGAAFDDIKMPVDRKVNGITVDGNGIVVGIIDDGCAFAHLDFLNPATTTTPPTTRVLLLWDQSPDAKPAAKGWVPVTGFTPVKGLSYGVEIPKADLDAAIAARVLPNGSVDEDKVYSDIGYDMKDDLASHGTHVMGIAAGNGKSSMGFEGIAPAADIIFVQLPKTDIAIGMSALTDKIQDGVAYIFTRAAALGKQAVINISYGGYTGPHDGTSQIETAIDYWPAMQDGRAVVISAGNGFEADCHAHVEVNPGATSTDMRWIVHPFDPTLNFMQIWYPGNTTLELSVTAPGGQTLGPIKLGDHKNLALTSTGPVIGWVDHQTDGNNGDRRIELTLRPTYDDPLFPLTAVPSSGDAVAPAPSGIWVLKLKNTGNHKASVHAWIERDDAGRPSGARRRQSQFVAADADAKFSVAGLATGHQTIAVGAYNTGTHEVCRYSACGPTRPTGNQGHRQKPDVCAPAEDDARGRGVLSASSRKSRATRMNGTSSAAPHVAGLVALLMQYRRDTGAGPPNGNQIRAKLKGAANKALLRPNRHNEADATRLAKLKQSNVMQELIGSGRIDVGKTF